MKVAIAIDSFKRSLSSVAAGNAVSEGWIFNNEKTGKIL